MLKLFISLLVAFALMHVSVTAQAGGSVSFTDDVLPLLEPWPEALEPLLREYEISDPGEGVRIGRLTCPSLAGKVIAPYQFKARARSHPEKALLLIVNTDVHFFDKDGQVVYEIRDGIPEDDDRNLSHAVKLEEKATSLVLRPWKTVGPDRSWYLPLPQSNY